jgi:hypothetical protein
MGVWYYYYSAPSDEAAVAAINRIGERLPAWPFAIRTVRSSLFVERSKDRYVETKLVDPALALRDLEALLTGREYKDVAGYDGDPLVENEDDLLIVPLTNTISAALADADDERLPAVVMLWSRIGEFPDPRGEPEELVRWLLPWLRELAALARRARERSERLYCWYVV